MHYEYYIMWIITKLHQAKIGRAQNPDFDEKGVETENEK